LRVHLQKIGEVISNSIHKAPINYLEVLDRDMGCVASAELIWCWCFHLNSAIAQLIIAIVPPISAIDHLSFAIVHLISAIVQLFFTIVMTLTRTAKPAS
jgi:hypothetical protein